MMTNLHCSKILALSGFMGCGKSSIGLMIAQRTGAQFIDLDHVIEQKSGLTIPEIFANGGEERFRKMEIESLVSVIEEVSDNGKAAVLSLGGGTLTTPECAETVKRYTKCVYLKASTDTLASNLKNCQESRPMLKECKNIIELSERIEKLMSQREAIYESTAAIIIITDGKTPEDITTEIINTI